MINIIWSSAALNDLKRLQFFVRQENPRSALIAIETIKNNVQNLAYFPDIGMLITNAGSWRELYIPYGKCCYVVRYKRKDSNVMIVRIWHSRENRIIKKH